MIDYYSNTIHPTAIIGPNVSIGFGNDIGPYCVIQGDTVIGSNNKFEAYCSIGAPAEHRDFFYKDGKVVIGNSNIFREFVTVNGGTEDITTIGNECVFLRNSHVGHDSIIKNKVNLSCNVLIGGHSHIMEGANFGLGSICHQFSIIGAYAMIGMGAIITKGADVAPGVVYVGNPAKYLKINQIGLDRNKITAKLLAQLKDEYTVLRAQKHT